MLLENQFWLLAEKRAKENHTAFDCWLISSAYQWFDGLNVLPDAVCLSEGPCGGGAPLGRRQRVDSEGGPPRDHDAPVLDGGVQLALPVLDPLLQPVDRLLLGLGPGPAGPVQR